jgi:hypothetical protein
MILAAGSSRLHRLARQGPDTLGTGLPPVPLIGGHGKASLQFNFPIPLISIQDQVARAPRSSQEILKLATTLKPNSLSTKSNPHLNYVWSREVSTSELKTKQNKTKQKTQTEELGRAKARNFKQKFYIDYSRNQ